MPDVLGEIVPGVGAKYIHQINTVSSGAFLSYFWMMTITMN